MEINVMEQRFLKVVNKIMKPDHRFYDIEEFEQFAHDRGLMFRFHCKKYNNPVKLMTDLLFKGWQKCEVVTDLNDLMQNNNEFPTIMPYPVIIFPGFLNELFAACPFDSAILDTISGSVVVCGREIIVCTVNVFLKDIFGLGNGRQ